MRTLAFVATAAVALLASGGDRSTALVTIEGGPHAGNFVLRNADIPCDIVSERAPRPRHQFEVTFENAAAIDSATPTVFTLVIPDADVRGANHAFYALVTFGAVANGLRYVADTRSASGTMGSGSVTIVPDHNDASVAFEISPAEGPAFKGAIQCDVVAHW